MKFEAEFSYQFVANLFIELRVFTEESSKTGDIIDSNWIRSQENWLKFSCDRAPQNLLMMRNSMNLCYTTLFQMKLHQWWATMFHKANRLFEST